MKLLYIVLFGVLFLASCVDSLDDYNIDQKNATVAPPATLFTNATKNLTDIVTIPNVNFNNFRLYAQYWSTTTYLDEPRYNMTSRLTPQQFWEAIYKDCLVDLKESKRLVESDEFIEPNIRANELAQITIIEVYAWSVLVNTYGNIPYSEALDPEISLPNYDDAATIYTSLFDKLNTALESIDPSASGFGEGDLFYGGDMHQWILFGNSLKLTMGMTVSDVASFDAETIVGEAVSDGVFESNADNARFPYLSSPPNNNPISANLNPTYSSRQDYIIASTLVDPMNELNDPRREFYFTMVDGAYVGGNYGFANDYANFSHVTDAIIDETFEGLLLDYEQVEFLLAEAVERGYNVGGTASEHYNKAITASILYWGGTETDATTYLSQPEVAYTTAAGDFREKIGFQKWLALYNRGVGSWREWRRLDSPDLQPPTGEGASGLVIPLRMIYPINEQTLNGANRTEASAAIGGDDAETALFWDIH